MDWFFFMIVKKLVVYFFTFNNMHNYKIMNEIEDQLKQILKSLIQDQSILCHVEMRNSKSFTCALKIENDKEIVFIHENMFESKPDILISIKFLMSFDFYILECHIKNVNSSLKTEFDSSRSILLSKTEFDTFKEVLYKRQLHDINKRSDIQFSNFITEMQKHLEANKIITHIEDL